MSCRINVRFAVLAILSATSFVGSSLFMMALAQDDKWIKQRNAMVETIRDYADYAPQAIGKEGISPKVLKVMDQVPRHLFVLESVRFAAYKDRPLPIGYGQTISQPLIVALMSHLLKVDADDTVLEVGTGSGYQAAVLSPLVGQVCTIEIIPPLSKTAAKRLKKLGYNNIRTKISDGYNGWPECGPFDAIIVTAAASHVPPPLVKQLKKGGRMVIPVGGAFATQYLTLVTKSATGQIKTRQLLPVRFVPFTRAQ